MPAEYAILQVALPGRSPQNIGVLLRRFGQLDFRFREDWEEIADPEDAAVLAGLPEAFRHCIQDMGADAFLTWIGEAWSNVLQVTDLREQKGRSSLGELFRDHIERPYPHFASLKAAAHEFDQEWGDAREAGGAEYFTAPIDGRSMEPDIPDGSRCLFRRTRGGSHRGKVVLIQRAGSLPESARYTVKRYQSEKKFPGEGEWEHSRVWAVPLNPEFESFELTEADKVIAEFIRVID